MPLYDCHPPTLWMLLTLLPVVALYFLFMRAVSWWSSRQYPRLVADMNRRRLFENGMVVGGLFVFLLAWGSIFEALCRV